MTDTDEPTLTIGQVAQRAGLNTSRIRFYERTGVLRNRTASAANAATTPRSSTDSRSSTSRNAPA